MKNKIVVSCFVLILVLVAIVFAMGERQGNNNKLAQEYKIYVSRHGFSINYPVDWTVKEWPEQPRMVGQPVNLFDDKGNNLEFGLYHFDNQSGKGDIKGAEDNQDVLRNRVKHLNLIKEFEGEFIIKIGGASAYVYYGRSNFNPGARFIVAMIYLGQIKDYLIVQEEIYQGVGFDNRLKVFVRALRWITI
jgi:hypothetical protein